jgi:phage/plasmid-associated DNA primase
VTAFDMLENSHGTSAFLRPVPWILHEAFDQSKWHFSALAKALLSGDHIQVNEKGNPNMITHRFTQPIAWGTNYPPQFKDASDAMRHRLLIVKLHHVFDPEAPIGTAVEAQKRGYARIADMILDLERPGLLNWAIEGLMRLQQRGHYEQTEEMTEAMHEVQLDSNLVAGMLEEYVEYDPDMMVSVANFHAAYASWWGENHDEKNVPPPHSVGRALKLNDKIGVDRKQLRYNGQRYYAGIKLNEDGLHAWHAHETVDRGVLTSERSEHVNKSIPPEWAVKDVVKRIRKAHQK